MSQSRWRSAAIGCGLFAAAVVIYLANGQTITSYDSAPTTVFAYNLFENHRLDYDVFRRSYFNQIGGGYAFIEAPNGHLTSLFPIGTSLLTLPIFSTLYVLHTLEQSGPPMILSPTFEDERHHDEKIVAAIIAAFAVVLLYFTARLFATPLQAAVSTFAFGFASEMWTIGSQGLWQHGPVNLILLCTIFATLRALRDVQLSRSRAWLALAGLCAGALPTIRPTAILFTIAIAFFVLTLRELRFANGWFGLGIIAGLLPGIAWSTTFFHSLTGGYAADLNAYDFLPSHMLAALGGLLISPSRGWMIFSPVIIFSIIGFSKAARAGDAPARLIAILGGACVMLLINYACYGGWIGGHCYGPRFLTDMAAITALALVYIIPASPLLLRHMSGRRRVITAVFVATLVASTGIQMVGSFSGAAGPVWNAIPVDVGRQPARVWALRDTQIARNTRAMFYRYAPVFPTGGPSYAIGFAGTVTSVDPISHALTGSSPLIRVRIRNVGTSIWYGYDTAVYNGEARIRATIATLQGSVLSQQELYIPGRVHPGAVGLAQGLIALPITAGVYALTLEPIAFGRTDIPPHNLHGTRTLLHVE